MNLTELLSALGRVFRRALQTGDVAPVLDLFARHLDLQLRFEETSGGEGTLFPVEDTQGNLLGYLQALPPDRAVLHAETLQFVAHLIGWVLQFQGKAEVLKAAQATSSTFLTGEQPESLGNLLEVLRRQAGVDSLVLCEVVGNRCRIQGWAGDWPPQEELVGDAVDRARRGRVETVVVPPESPLLRLTDFQRAWILLLRDPEGEVLGAVALLSRNHYSPVDLSAVDPWKGFLLLGLDRRRWLRLLRSTMGSVVLSMVALEEMRDPYTRGHSERVARYATEIARRLNLPPARIEKLYFASLLHDIGKVAIPDILLMKPVGLQEHEMEIVRTHVRLGYEILRHIDAFRDVAEWVLAHHERWDGTGYPRGLKGDAIPPEAQIIAISDVFDALTSTRPYRRAYGVEDALRILEEESGKAFDPRIVPVAVEVLRELSQKPLPQKATPLLYVYLDRVRKESALSFAEIGVLMNAILRFWAEEALDEILQDVLETTIRIFHFDGGFFREIEGDDVVLKAYYGVSGSYVEAHRRIPFLPFQGWVERGIQEGYLYFRDIRESPMLRRFFHGLMDEGVVSLLVIPLYARHRKERIHGYLSFFNRYVREVPPEQVRLLSQIGRHLGLLMDYREREEREHLYQQTLLEVLDILRGSRHRGRVNLRRVVRFLGERAGLPRNRIRALDVLVSFVDMDHFLAPDLLRIKLLHGMDLTPEERAFLDRLEGEVRNLIGRLHLPEDWKEILEGVFEGNPVKVEGKILYAVRVFRKHGERLDAVEKEVGHTIPLRLYEDFREALDRFQEPPEDIRAALYEDLYAFLREISVIYEIGAHLEDITDVRSFARRVLESIARVTGFDSLFLLARRRGVLEVLASWGFPEEVLGQAIPEERGLVGRAVRTGQITLVQDTSRDPEYIAPAGQTMGSALVVPLKLRGDLVGVLAVENREPHAFSPQHVRFLNLVSRYIAPVVYLLMEETGSPGNGEHS